jgi:hypothetical protein
LQGLSNCILLPPRGTGSRLKIANDSLYASRPATAEATGVAARYMEGTSELH